MSLSTITQNLVSKYVMIPVGVVVGLASYFLSPSISTKTSYKTANPTAITTQAKGLENIVVKAGVQEACAYEEGNFDNLVPDLEGYEKIVEWPKDVDKNGDDESYIRVFENADGDRIFKYTHGKNGEVWCWAKLHHDKNVNDLENNYFIAKKKANGSFDIRGDIEEDIPVPNYVKNNNQIKK